MPTHYDATACGRRPRCEEDLFDRISDISFRLFERGTDIAASRGLILVDTKYEFAGSWTSRHRA